MANAVISASILVESAPINVNFDQTGARSDRMSAQERGVKSKAIGASCGRTSATSPGIVVTVAMMFRTFAKADAAVELSG